MKPSEIKNISKLMEKRARVTEDLSVYLATSQVVVLHMRHPKIFETKYYAELWKDQCNKLLDDISTKTRELKEYLNDESGGDTNKSNRPSLSLKLISRHYTDDDMDHLNPGYSNGIDAKDFKDATIKEIHPSSPNAEQSDENSDSSELKINSTIVNDSVKEVNNDAKVTLTPIAPLAEMFVNTDEYMLEEMLKISDISDNDLDLSDITVSSESDEKPEYITNRIPKKKKKKVDTSAYLANNLELFKRECCVNLIRFDVKLYEAFVAKHRKFKLSHLTEFLKLAKKRKRRSTSSSDSSLSSESLTNDQEMNSTNFNNSYDTLVSIYDQKPLNFEDEMMAAMNQISDSDATILDTDLDSDSDSKRKIEKDKVKKKTKKMKVISSDLDTDFEPEIITPSKSSWRQDPLLRENFDFNKENTDKANYDLIKKEEKVEALEELNSPKRDSQEDNSNNSDSDFVPVEDSNHSTTDSVDSDVECLEDVTFSPGKGRKNIRPMLEDEALHEATQKANKLEQEKQKRVAELKNSVSSFVQSQSSDRKLNGLLLDVDKISMKPIIVVNANLTHRLKEHQQEGVKFMWNACFETVEMISNNKGSGCILAHCMGLGKTFQVTTLIHTLFAHPATKVKHVLIICPISTVPNWNHEFVLTKKIAECGSFKIFYKSRSKINIRTIVLHWREYGGVLILGYDAFLSLVSRKKLQYSISKSTIKLLEEALRNPGPDLLVCDEGHLLKNQNKMKYKAVDKIKTKRRIILTGTPMQNNLTEYYYMVQLIKPNLLGTFKEFTNRFNNPIVNGQYGDSTTGDIKIMKQRSHVLHEILKETVQRYEESELNIYLPPKVDYALYIQMDVVQASLYGDILNKLRSNHDLGKKFTDFFSHYQLLMPFWMHPCIAFTKEKNKKPIEYETITSDNLHEKVIDLTPDLQEKFPIDVEYNIKYGAKFVVIMAIIEECIKIEDRLLIFSTSLFTLDAIEHFLKLANKCNNFQWVKNLTYFRLDGQVLPIDRVDVTDKFNDKNSNARLMLMTNKVGGLGLNIVAANRIILADISWNPALDTQSIFRSYRFGQEKPVYIYRLIARGTMEETVYRRAVTKVAIAGRVVDEQQIDRHYRSVDLQEIYRFHYNKEEVRPIPKVPTDDLLATLLQMFPAHIFGYDEHNSLFLNRPDEELNEEEMKEAWVEFNKERAPKPVPQLVPLVPSTSAMDALNILNHRYLDGFLPSKLSSIPTQFSAAAVTNTTSTTEEVNNAMLKSTPPVLTPKTLFTRSTLQGAILLAGTPKLNALLASNPNSKLPLKETRKVLSSYTQNALNDVWLSKQINKLLRLPLNTPEKPRMHMNYLNNSSISNGVHNANYNFAEGNTDIVNTQNKHPISSEQTSQSVFQSKYNMTLNNTTDENKSATKTRKICGIDRSIIKNVVPIDVDKIINLPNPVNEDQAIGTSTPRQIVNRVHPFNMINILKKNANTPNTSVSTIAVQPAAPSVVTAPEDFIVNPFLPSDDTTEPQETNDLISFMAGIANKKDNIVSEEELANQRWTKYFESCKEGM